jgi:hypothetical protein
MTPSNRRLQDYLAEPAVCETLSPSAESRWNNFGSRCDGGSGQLRNRVSREQRWLCELLRSGACLAREDEELRLRCE